MGFRFGDLGSKTTPITGVNQLLQQLVIFVAVIKERLTASESHQVEESRERVSFFCDLTLANMETDAAAQPCVSLGLGSETFHRREQSPGLDAGTIRRSFGLEPWRSSICSQDPFSRAAFQGRC